jgi:hypothetical protein
VFFPSYAQLDNRLFYDQYEIQNDDSGAIKLGFDVSGYFWNNEYSSEIAPGYTLFGYQFKPYICYIPVKHLRLDIGGFFMKDFGDSSFVDLRPVFTIKYQKNNFSFLFGSIEGASSHRLIEPLYYLQRVISRRIEEGLQFKWVSDRLFFDAWLDWENMIHFGDDEKEIFNVGLSFSYTVYRSKSLNIEIPFQFMVHHKGGQIDVNDQPAETLYNAALGISLIFPFQTVSWLKYVRTDNYFAGQGQGFFLNVSSRFIWFDLALSYWNGNSYIAPQGTPIYQSISMDYLKNGYTEEHRKLLFLRITYEHDFAGGLSLALRFEPVYDFGTSKLDHMEVLFLRYKTNFILNKKKLR